MKSLFRVVLPAIFFIFFTSVSAAKLGSWPPNVYGPYILGNIEVLNAATLSAQIFVWPDFSPHYKIRLQGVVVPGANSDDLCEQVLAASGVLSVKGRLMGSPAIMLTDVRGHNDAGQVVGNILYIDKDGTVANLANVLVKHKLARLSSASNSDGPWCGKRR